MKHLTLLYVVLYFKTSRGETEHPQGVSVREQDREAFRNKSTMGLWEKDKTTNEIISTHKIGGVGKQRHPNCALVSCFLINQY